jgi:hypothetical protein
MGYGVGEWRMGTRWSGEMREQTEEGRCQRRREGWREECKPRASCETSQCGATQQRDLTNVAGSCGLGHLHSPPAYRSAVSGCRAAAHGPEVRRRFSRRAAARWPVAPAPCRSGRPARVSDRDRTGTCHQRGEHGRRARLSGWRLNVAAISAAVRRVNTAE